MRGGSKRRRADGVGGWEGYLCVCVFEGRKISINGRQRASRQAAVWCLIRSCVVTTLFLPSSNLFCFISRKHGMKSRAAHASEWASAENVNISILPEGEKGSEKFKYVDFFFLKCWSDIEEAWAFPQCMAVRPGNCGMDNIVILSGWVDDEEFSIFEAYIEKKHKKSKNKHCK